MVVCKGCRERLAMLERDGQSASTHYGVGKRGRDETGHAMFFNGVSQVALCNLSRFRRGAQ